MAMIPGLWSLAALGVELNMDRRTVAARLRSVKPDGMLRGKPAWRLPTALAAIKWQAPPAPPPGRADPPASMLVLEHVSNPVHGGAVIGALLAIYSSTWWGKFCAEQEGVDPERAERIGTGVSLMLTTLFEREFRGMGIEYFQSEDPDWLQPEQCWWQPGRGLREDLALPEASPP